MRPLAPLALALVLAACGSSTAPNVMDIAGTWNFTGNISNGALAASCQSTSTATVSQSGSSFSGTGSNGTEVCTQNGSVISNVSGLTSTFSGGQINASGVSFVDDGGCTYTGNGSGSPTNRLTGNVSCTVAVSGSQYVFTGTWTGSR